MEMDVKFGTAASEPLVLLAIMHHNYPSTFHGSGVSDWAR